MNPKLQALCCISMSVSAEGELEQSARETRARTLTRRAQYTSAVDDRPFEDEDTGAVLLPQVELIFRDEHFKTNK